MDRLRQDALRHRRWPRLVLVTVVLFLAGCGTIPNVFGPVNYGGSVNNITRATVPASGEASTGNQVVTSVGASSYLWQKWFAGLLGSIDMSHSVNSSAGERSDALAVGGSISINALPMSRFPSGFNYNRKDSRTGSTGLEDEDERTVSNRYSLNSSMSLGNGLSARGSYAWGDVERKSQGVETRNDAQVSVSKPFGRQRVSLNASHRTRSFSGVDSDDFQEVNTQGTLSHSFSPTETTSVYNVFVYSDRSNQLPAVEMVRQTLQGFGSISWRPVAQSYKVNGGYRIQKSSVEIRPNNPDLPILIQSTTSADSNAALNYTIRPRLTAQASARFSLRKPTTQIKVPKLEDALPADDPSMPLPYPLGRRSGLKYLRSLGQEPSAVSDPASDVLAADPDGLTWTSGLAGGLGYGSPGRSLSGFDWRWRANGSLGGSYASTSQEWETSADMSAGQSADRRVELPWLGEAQLTLAQDINSGISSSGEAPIVSLGSYGGLNYSRVKDTTNTSVMLSMTDSRNFGGKQTGGNQNANLMIVRSGKGDMTSGWHSNLAFNLAREKNGFVFMSASGGAGYWKVTLFDVPNLFFNTNITLHSAGLEEAFLDQDRNVGVEEKKTETEWRSRIGYRIGKMAVLFEANANKTAEDINWVFQLRIARYFDNYDR